MPSSRSERYGPWARMPTMVARNDDQSMPISAVLRAAADRLEQLETAASHKGEASGERYFIRSTAPKGAGGRTWDKAVAELAKEGRVFRPGRECMIRCDDFFAWIETHPLERVGRSPIAQYSEPDDAPIPF